MMVCLAACGSGARTSSTGDTLLTPIHAVQGVGASSPLAGQQVTLAGIVTGDFQQGAPGEHGDFGGFFLQDEHPDTDPRTSEGVFVFDGNMSRTDVRAGDRVVVTGVVTEHFGETQLDAAVVDVTGRGAAGPTDLLLPLGATVINGNGEPIADIEAYEGMLVSLPQPLTVIDLFGLERFGEVLLAQGGRVWQYTNSHPPDVAGYVASREDAARRSLVLDDGYAGQNERPVRYLFPGYEGASGRPVRAGDTVTGLTGVVRYSRGSGASGTEAFRLQPVRPPVFAAVNERPPEPPDVGGSIRVMSFNALNYFTTLDNGTAACGPSANSACRGANTQAEFERQRDKIVTVLLAADIDVVGMIEMENNESRSFRSLVDEMNRASATNRWSFVDTGVIGTDAIRVGLIYDSSVVSAVGPHAVLDTSVDARFLDTRNRPSLAQTFAAVSNNGRFTVVINHLKSKGSGCDDLGDPDIGDGQSACNRTRTRAALALADWVASDPTGSGDPDVLIIGDMNAYLREDPARALVAAGYDNLLDRPDGARAYSYVYRGAVGAIDHAFVSQSMAPQVRGVAEWHINADESPALDYNLDFGRDGALYDATTPYRVSDHDPVIVGLDVDGG